MRRTTALVLVFAGCLAASAALAQLPPVAPATPAAVPAPISPTDPPVAPAVDAAPATAPTDTLRRPIPAPVGLVPDAPEKITRPLAVRIAAAIAVLTLSTLLLYNVRSR